MLLHIVKVECQGKYGCHIYLISTWVRETFCHLISIIFEQSSTVTVVVGAEIAIRKYNKVFSRERETVASFEATNSTQLNSLSHHVRLPFDCIQCSSFWFHFYCEVFFHSKQTCYCAKPSANSLNHKIKREKKNFHHLGIENNVISRLIQDWLVICDN